MAAPDRSRAASQEAVGASPRVSTDVDARLVRHLEAIAAVELPDREEAGEPSTSSEAAVSGSRMEPKLPRVAFTAAVGLGHGPHACELEDIHGHANHRCQHEAAAGVVRVSAAAHSRAHGELDVPEWRDPFAGSRPRSRDRAARRSPRCSRPRRWPNPCPPTRPRRHHRSTRPKTACSISARSWKGAMDSFRSRSRSPNRRSATAGSDARLHRQASRRRTSRLRPAEHLDGGRASPPRTARG